MKLQAELLPLIERIESMKGYIEEYAKDLKENGRYKVFRTRLAGDVIRLTTPIDVICSWYSIYDCHDEHIQTLAKAAIDKVFGKSFTA